MKLFIYIISFTISIVVLIIFTTKIKFKIYKRINGVGTVDIYISIFKVVHIDLGRKFKKYIDDYTVNDNIKRIINYMKVSRQYNYLIDKYMKCITINKAIFVPSYNSTSPLLFPYITFIDIQLINIFKIYIHKCRKVKYEYYNMMLNDNTKQGVNIDIEAEVPIYLIIITFLKNINNTINFLKKTNKGEKASGREQTIY